MTEREPIPISWVSKDDLINCRPDLQERLEALDVADVDYIAEKVGDCLQETYRLAMEIVLSEYFGEDDQSAQGG
jgi:hypothetical protein